ncbi:MAG: hypothetical protein Q8P79_02260 [Nanoarchaeota archaeon]|nr:hypothetical protein [Nanoarchaeota archaeon]
MAKKRGLKHHLIHKGKLSLLLISKIILVFFSFFLVMAVLSFFSPWADISGQVSFFSIMIWGIGSALATTLYLFLVLKMLDLFKFK